MFTIAIHGEESAASMHEAISDLTTIADHLKRQADDLLSLSATSRLDTLTFNVVGIRVSLFKSSD